MKCIFIYIYLFYHFMIHVGNLIKTYYVIFIICAYTQSFVIIKKKEIIDPIIDFDDYQTLSNYDSNHVFEGWM